MTAVVPDQQSIRQSVDEMRTAFRLFDMNGCGKVPTSEVPLLLYAVGVDGSIADVESALMSIVGEQLRDVDFSDFRRLVEFMSMTPDSSEEAASAYDLICRQYASAPPVSGDEATAAVDDALVMLPSTVSRLLAIATPFTQGTRGSTFTVERLFDRMDVDKDGVVSKREWIDYVSARPASAQDADDDV